MVAPGRRLDFLQLRLRPGRSAAAKSNQFVLWTSGADRIWLWEVLVGFLHKKDPGPARRSIEPLRLRTRSMNSFIIRIHPALLLPPLTLSRYARSP